MSLKAVVVMVQYGTDDPAALITVVGAFDDIGVAKGWGEKNIGKMCVWFATEMLPPPMGGMKHVEADQATDSSPIPSEEKPDSESPTKKL